MNTRNGFRDHHVRSTWATGFTLLEVLITLVILSIGLVSIAALQAQVLRDSYSSLQRTVVSIQANDLVERLWVGRCDSTNFPDAIFEAWTTESAGFPLFQNWGVVAFENETVVPGSSLGAGPNYRIEISWDDTRASRVNSNTQTPQEVTANFNYWFRIPTNDCPLS